MQEKFEKGISMAFKKLFDYFRQIYKNRILL